MQLADKLGLTRSQLIDEALTLFLKAVLEIKRGRRLVTLDPRTSQPACELATPTLSALALEWALQPESPRARAARERLDDPLLLELGDRRAVLRRRGRRRSRPQDS